VPDTAFFATDKIFFVPQKTVTGDSFTNSENSERVACHRI
jgi:hypothetical protein